MRRRPDFIVGMVVLATIVALLGSIIWVRQTDVSRRRQHVTARFQDVGNARVGNAAVIRGVRAGRIDRIELDDDGSVMVRMSLEKGAVLPADPVVVLNESSLFGEWQATITERAALPRDEAIQEQIEIVDREDDLLPGATLPDIAKLTAVAGQIAGDVAAVAGRVDVAFDDAAAKELRASIQNFSALSATLAGAVRDHTGDLDTLSAGLRDAVRTLNRAARSTELIVGRVDSSIASGELRQIMKDLSDAAADLKRTTATVSGMATRLSGSQGHLDRFLVSGDSVLTKINGGQGTLGRLVTDSSLYVGSDSLVAQLRSLIVEMRANPKKFLSIRLF
ncbi:MAG TPA: MlaD family protein [Gemmatimonadaceae bacterium]|nr:MlaD family protein [Gemmatimonadaceae bacterium]